MNPRRSLQQKVIYLAGIAVLLWPIARLSMPAAGVRPFEAPAGEAKEEGAGRAGGAAGGKLAQLRVKYGLTEAQIGQVDPTVETIRLATLGMRGVAANILWEKANDYKMKKDWSNLDATLNQLVRLEPHFITVWRHLGWNLSYNVSAEFDDYRDRYYYLIRGIRFLEQGTRYNERSPHLLWDIGWYVSHKVGRADEHKEFRVLFKEDEDFHGPRPLEYRDNWLVGKEWFAKAEDLVAKGASLKQTSPVLFYSDYGMCQMNYAEALEADGIFQEKAKRAWQQAYREWTGYEPEAKDASGQPQKAEGLDRVPFGERELAASDEEKIRLNEKEELLATSARLRAALEALEPGLREKLVEEERRNLRPAERKALDTPPEDRTPEQHELAWNANLKINVRPEDVARRIGDRAKREQGRQLADEIKQAEKLADLIDRHREIVNFEYWRRHAQVEQTDEALAAREHIYNGDQLASIDPLGAKEAYAKGFASWRAVLARFPGLIDDEATARDLTEILERYTKILDRLDEVFPEDFALADFVRRRVDKQPQIREARAALEEGKAAWVKGEARAARKAFDRGFAAWRSILEAIPSLGMMADRKVGAELMDAVNRYAAVLEKLNETFPQDFPLQDFVRVQVQHAPGAQQARELLSKAERLLADQKHAEARKEFDRAFAAWRQVLDRFPKLVRLADRKTTAQLLDAIARYNVALKALNEKFPEKFILQDVIDSPKK